MVWGTFQSFLKSQSPMGPALGQEEVRVFWVRSTDMVSFQCWAGMCYLMRDGHSPHPTPLLSQALVTPWHLSCHRPSLCLSPRHPTFSLLFCLKSLLSAPFHRNANMVFLI